MPRSSSTRWSQGLPARCPLARCSPHPPPPRGGGGDRGRASCKRAPRGEALRPSCGGGAGH
eukprot:3755108-Alexandrium_andersonii.AAC.1